MSRRILYPLVITVSGLIFAACSQASAPTADAPAQSPNSELQAQSPVAEPDLDVPYVPTPPGVVSAMLEVAQVGKDDVLYDLGSGDGRIPITAAKRFGTRGVGVDIDPERIQEANDNAQKEGVGDRVQFRQQDLFETDLSEATVITLYLLPQVNLDLRPKLLQLQPGTRIVSHSFDMGDWKPDRTLQVDGSTIHYWVVPEQVPANLR
jgi:hypothetical protein